LNNKTLQFFKHKISKNDVERVLCELLLVGYTWNRYVHRAPVTTGQRTRNAVSIHKI